MRLFFAGAESPEYAKLCVKHHQDILMSFAYCRGVQQFFRQTPDYRIFLDSGAFTAYKQGTPIDLDEYIAFIKEHEKNIEQYALLDVIGDHKGTAKNLKIMEDAGLSPIPVFHGGEPLDALDALLERYGYIALGGLTGWSLQPKKLMAWLDTCFSRIKHHWPKKIHGFGMTNVALWKRYPFYSVDSTSWLSSARYGQSKFTKNKKLSLYQARQNHYVDRTERELLLCRSQANQATRLWKQRGVVWQ